MRLEGPIWAAGVGGGESWERENKEARECVNDMMVCERVKERKRGKKKAMLNREKYQRALDAVAWI